jgi:hypothetical protein
LAVGALKDKKDKFGRQVTLMFLITRICRNGSMSELIFYFEEFDKLDRLFLP